MSWQMNNECRAADNYEELEVVQSVSVSVKKSCFDEHGINNLDKLLENIQKKQLERKHVIHVERLDSGCNLKGCFCGIKAVREELQQILKEKIEEEQKQEEMRNKDEQLVTKQTVVVRETNEADGQTINDKRSTTMHIIQMDRDLYDYLLMNEELPKLCHPIKECETVNGFAIKIELNVDEDVDRIRNNISALQNRFVVWECEVSENMNSSKFEAQRKNNAMIFFDRKKVKVIGSPKEVNEVMQKILTMSAAEHCEVKDGFVTKNHMGTVNEKMHKHPDKKVTTTKETKTDQTRMVIEDSESEYPEKQDTTKNDSIGNDSKTLTDDMNLQHPYKQVTIRDDTKDKMAQIDDTSSEHQHKSIKAIAKTISDDKKTLNDNKSENPDTEGPTTYMRYEVKEDSKKISNDDFKSYLNKNGTANGDDVGDDKKTLLTDTLERQAEKFISNDASENDKYTLNNNANPEYRDINVTAKDDDTTKDDAEGYDDETLTDDTMSRQDQKVTTNIEARGDNKKTTENTMSEYPKKKVTTENETIVHDKKTLENSTAAAYSNKTSPTSDKTNYKKTTEDSKSFPDEDDNMGYDKNSLIDHTKSKCQDKQGPTQDNTVGDNHKSLTDHSDYKSDVTNISSEGAMEGGWKESNVKFDITEKDDKDKESSLEEESAMLCSKTGNKLEYDNKNQQIQSPDAANTVQQPAKQRSLMHFILMDEDAYVYIQRFLRQELDDVKELCNSVQELRDEASTFNVGYAVKCEDDDERVGRRFQQLKDQVKVEEYNVPDTINADDLEGIVHASVKSEGTMTFVQSDRNSLKLVGRPDTVDKLKKYIEETVSEQLLSHEQLSEETTDYTAQPCKQQFGTKVSHHTAIDTNLYTYISLHCQPEIERASKYCTSIKFNENRFSIDFELKDKRNEKFVIDTFEKLTGRFRVEQYKVPMGIDFAVLASAIQEMNTSKEVMIFPYEDEQFMKLIGPQTKVSKTKKWIESLVSGSKQSEHINNPNSYHSPIKDQPKSSKQSILTSLHEGNPVNPLRKPSECFRITSTTSDTLVYESNRVTNQLKVRVHFANIIKQNTDVLVSCEDVWLQGCTYIAIAIKDAAGPDVERELAKIITKNQRGLDVGQVVHTSAGKLGPSVKYLVHAVTDKYSQHQPEDPKTFEILYKTFLNCLKYTNDKICQKSISILPIGSRKYGVEMVSAAFSQAVQEYDAIAETTRSRINLRSIHFVDQNPKVVKQMITSIKSLI